MPATIKTQELARILTNTFEHHRREAAKINEEEGKHIFKIQIFEPNLITIQLPDLPHLLAKKYLNRIFSMIYDIILDVGYTVVETIQIHLHAHDGSFRDGRSVYAKNVN